MSSSARNVWAVCALCLWALRAAAASAQPHHRLPDAAGPQHRLPDTTEPVSYELRIRPELDPAGGNCTFSGHVDIAIRAKAYGTAVVLNSKDLAVSSVTGFVDARTGRPVPVAGYRLDDAGERLVISLGRPVVPTRVYRFTVAFHGTLRNDFTGFHRYFYDAVQSSRWIALTQFKPIYARRAFPCYDEPGFKTPYKISIARQIQHFSLSNMPLKKIEIDVQSGWAWDHFETTKPIPTYLVAFMVSDFDKKALNNNNLAMYLRKEFIDDTEYMMEKAPNLLEGVEKFTQIPYMLPKLDMVGVPSLDEYNMENWGLNSYKELYLTISNNSLLEDEIMGSMAVLHEILHQWFGNMVTTPWWDYVWLNEGFCNYLNYYILDTIEPEWELNKQFMENVHQRAMAWDEYSDTHPLTFALYTPEEIVNAFDVITYYKSAALFRTLKHMVGETIFKTSLNKFLNDFAYAGAGPKELWETFDNVLYDAGADGEVSVNESMYLWTEQAGYPLVNVTSVGNGSVLVTQERFLVSDSEQTDSAKWFVGLTYTTERDARFDDLAPTVWLKPSEEGTVIDLAAGTGWTVFNLQSTGFYRVNYDEKNWKLLLIQLITKPDRIHYLNRAQIVDDAHHLSRAAVLPYGYYISLLEYLLMEDHVAPWSAAAVGLSAVADAIRRYPAEHAQFEAHVKRLAGILYGKLAGGRMDGQPTGIGRLLTWSCKMGDPRCEESAKMHFDDWTRGHAIPPGFEEAAFCAGMEHGNHTVWSGMYDFYKTTRSASYKQYALRSFACIGDAQTLSNFSYSNSVRLDEMSSTRNFKTVCESVTTTPQGVKALADYLLYRLDAILALDGGRENALFAYSVLGSKTATDDEIVMMNKIRLSTKSESLRTVFDQTYQKTLSNLKWMERDHKKIIKAIGK